MKKGIKLTAAAAVALAAITPVAASAAPASENVAAGIYTADKFYTIAEFKALSTAQKGQLLSAPKAALVTGGQALPANIIVTGSDTAIDAAWVSIAAYESTHGVSFDSGKGFETPETGDLKVESVSAITTTLKQEADQQLGFTVNGDKEVTLDELKEAGYTVKFLFNKNGVPKTAQETGKLDASTALFKDGFKYAVEITPEEGKAITSDWVDVKVVDATAPVKVTKVALTGASYKLDYVTFNDSTNVTIVAKEALNALGETVKENQLPTTIEKVTSSDPTVAYYDNGIKTRKEGKVTFTVQFKDIKEPVKVDVEVKAEQKVTSIKADNVKKVAGNGVTADLKVLDQYGEVIRNASTPDITYTVIDKDGKVVGTEDNALTVTNGAATVSADLTEEGVYTVEINGENDAKLGSFTIETVKIDESTVADEYKIVTSDGKDLKLDLNPEDGDRIATLAVKQYAKGVELDKTIANSNGVKFVVNSSDKDVVTAVKSSDNKGIVLEAKKAGKATISLVKEEGDLKTTLATYEVEVANTTKLIDKLTLQDDVKVEVQVSQDGKTVVSDQDALKDAVAAATVEGEKDANLAEKIEKVDVVRNDKVVIVKMTETYGGKEFVLDAKFVTDASVIVPVEPGNGGTEPGNGGTEPGNGGTEPGNGGTEPGNGGTEPGNGGTEPGNGGTEPGNGGTEPGNGGTEPGNGGTEPGNGGTEPGNGGTEPGNGGTEPGNGGTEPGNGGTEPGNGGTEPGNGGTEPGNGGTEPGNGGTEPGNGGTEPGNGGTEPGNGGTEPGNGGTEPGNGGTEPTQITPTAISLDGGITITFSEVVDTAELTIKVGEATATLASVHGEPTKVSLSFNDDTVVVEGTVIEINGVNYVVTLDEVNGGYTLELQTPVEDPTEPGNGGTEPGNGGTEPGNGGTEPGNGGTEPGNGGTEPGNGGTEPGNGGTEPGNGGTEPGNGGTEPGNGGTEPGNGGTEPGNGGTEPGNGGTEPGNGGTEPTI